MVWYIIFRPHEVESTNASVVDSEELLKKWLKDGSILEGDYIYEATKRYVASKQTIVTMTLKPDDSSSP